MSPDSMNTPCVSVIIPIFNVEPYLQACLDSVLGQTLRNIEVICVDDCSPDDSARVVRRCAAGDTRIRLLTHPANRGLAAARNSGLRSATGHYVTFMDSDDLYASAEALEHLYCMAGADAADEVIGGIVKWDPESGEMNRDWHERYLGDEVRARRLFELPELRANVIAVNKLLRREFLQAHDIRFNELIRKHEDNPFSIQAHALAERISITPLTTYQYRQVGATSITGTTRKSDVYYRYLYCRDVFRFVESYSDPELLRAMYYPMYVTQLLLCAGLLARYSPSAREIAGLVERWRELFALLPRTIPCLGRRQQRIVELVRSGARGEAWRQALALGDSKAGAARLSRELHELETLQERVWSKRCRLTALDSRLEQLRASRSWRITAPLRRAVEPGQDDE